MGMIRPDQVLSAWKAVWDGDASLPTLVPGGLHSPPVPGTAASPYATCKARNQPAQWTTGTAFLQRWTVEVRVWSNAGAVDAGAIDAALNSAFRQATKDSLSIASASRVVSLLPIAGEFGEPDGRKDRQDVLVTTARWELLLQGSR